MGTKRSKRGAAVEAKESSETTQTATAREVIQPVVSKKASKVKLNKWWEDANDIASLAQALETAAVDGSFLNIVLPFDTAEQTTLFGTLSKFISAASEILPPEDGFEADHAALQLFGLTIKLVNEYIAEERPNPPGLLTITQTFHDCILKFEHDTTRHLLPGMVSACEMWFLSQRPQHETVAPLTISYLLLDSLQESSKVADVKRVYIMRQALLLLDFADVSSQSLKTLILHTYMSALYLTTTEGRRFLVFALSLHVPLIDQIYATIRNQIPGAAKATLEVFGEILYKAWKVAEGPYLAKLEYDCIQDLMNHAVHAQVTPLSDMSMAVRLRKILNAFHSNKNQAGVDEMLFRLYEPILWRALKVANPIVRRNAGAVMVDAFPIREPNASPADIDDQMQRQFDSLMALLDDACPSVREVGVEGVCRVLTIFWELIPLQAITELVNRLTEQLAFDSSNVGVRLAVVNGLKYLLDNAPLSHASMKVPLKRIGSLIHDNAERVRIAMADLLLTVKSVPDIKFWEVVEIPYLLARLAVDSPKVCKRLTQLLQNSFFPASKSVSTQIDRAVILLGKNSAAARAFYYYLPRFASIDSVVALLQGLYCTAFDEMTSDGTKENATSNNATQEQRDNFAAHAESLLEFSAILLDSLAPSLKKDKKRYKACLSVFNDRPLNTLNESGVCTTESARSAVLILARHAPQAMVPQLAQHCLDKLTQSVSAEIPTLMGYLSDWGQTGRVVEMATNWLRDSPLTAYTTAKEKSRKKNSTASSLSSLSPVALAHAINAIDLIEAVLMVKESRDSLLNDASFASLMTLVGGSWRLLDDVIAQARFDDELLVQFTSRALTVHAKLDVHQWAAAADKPDVPTSFEIVLDKLMIGFGDLVLEERVQQAVKKTRKRKQQQLIKVSGALLLMRAVLSLSVEYCVLGLTSLAQTTRCVDAVRKMLSGVHDAESLALLGDVCKLLQNAIQQATLQFQEQATEASELLDVIVTLSYETADFVQRVGGEQNARQNLRLLRGPLSSLLQDSARLGQLDVVAKPLIRRAAEMVTDAQISPLLELIYEIFTSVQSDELFHAFLHELIDLADLAYHVAMTEEEEHEEDARVHAREVFTHAFAVFERSIKERVSAVQRKALEPVKSWLKERSLSTVHEQHPAREFALATATAAQELLDLFE